MPVPDRASITPIGWLMLAAWKAAKAVAANLPKLEPDCEGFVLANLKAVQPVSAWQRTARSLLPPHTLEAA